MSKITVNYMSHKEIETALEVISQHDLSPALAAEALKQVNERARSAPFNSYHAYHTAHSVCARLKGNDQGLSPEGE